MESNHVVSIHSESDLRFWNSLPKPTERFILRCQKNERDLNSEPATGIISRNLSKLNSEPGTGMI